MKLDVQTKRVIRKDEWNHACAYVYTDGIVIRDMETHRYKGERFKKEKVYSIPGEVKVFIHNANGEGPFKGRLVFHNATMLLDGIKDIKIYRNNTSNAMKERNISCDSITLRTLSGLEFRQDIFSFLHSDISIDNSKAMSITDWA